MLKITDISLRDCCEHAGVSLSFREKLELAALLESLRIDTIETGFVGNDTADAVTVKTIASSVGSCTVCCPVNLDREAIDRSWKAISCAEKPKLDLIMPASTVQLEYLCSLKPDKALSLARELISYCVSLCPDVEFTLLDATRSDRDFLKALILSACECGAKMITLSDCAGLLRPESTAAFINELLSDIDVLSPEMLCLSFSDSLDFATANAFAALECGIFHLKSSFDGSNTSAGCLSLQKLARAVSAFPDTFDTGTLNMTGISHICQKISSLYTSAHGSLIHSAFSSENNAVSELGPDTDIAALRRKATALGYDLPENELDLIREQVCALALKKRIYDRDVEALIADLAHQVPPTYRLQSYVINSGTTISATSVIVIEKDGEVLQSVSSGDGPIDASFHAIEQLTGRHFELDDFQISSVTEGREAMGEALIKLREGGKLYSGRGLSTDISAASILAYLNALNKIVYEEKISR